MVLPYRNGIHENQTFVVPIETKNIRPRCFKNDTLKVKLGNIELKLPKLHFDI